MPSVRFDHVRKAFGTATVVEDFDLTVADGELLVLVGGSGSGKSTILRMVAGLEEVTSGSIRIDDRDVTSLPPRERDVAMVFQDYGLYPHMTVRENLSLGLRLRKVARQEIDRRVSRSSYPAASASVWRWAARWCASQKCFCSMSRCPISTPDFARRCASRSEAFRGG
jgi:ABC-type sugar transport system ATPase subunit